MEFITEDTHLDDPLNGISSNSNTNNLIEKEDMNYNINQSELWLIDCRYNLFQKDLASKNTKKYWWKEIMEAAFENMKRLIISQPKTQFGIILFNTKYFLNDMGISGVYNILEFDLINQKRIQKIITESKVDQASFNLKYGGIDENIVSFCDVLWIVNNILWKKYSHKKKGYSCSITFFTTFDDPCKSLKDKVTATERAQDLRKNLADIHLIYLDIPGQSFDISKFYIDILGIDYDELEEYKSFSRSRLDSFKEKIRKKDVMRSSLFNNDFYITQNIKLSVKILISIYHQKVPSPIYVNPTDLTPIQRDYSWKIQGTEEEIDPADINFAIQFDQEKIFFTSDEFSKLKENQSPFMKLIGFLPIEDIKLQYNIDHSYFVVPDDIQIEGSSTLFSALHQSMFFNQKAALIDWLPKKGSLLRRAALISQMEKLNEFGEQIDPAGFLLIKLPFVEELRKLPIEKRYLTKNLYNNSKEGDLNSQEERISVEKAKSLLNCFLDESYTPSNYQNISLQMHYAILEALALDLEEPETIHNNFIDDSEELDHITEQNINDWLNSLGEDSNTLADIDNSESIQKNKARKLNSQQQNELLDLITVQKLYNDKNLQKLTVSQLKVFLESHLLSKSGSKKDLIMRVEDFFKFAS